MTHTARPSLRVMLGALLIAALPAWTAEARAQSVSGQAEAVRATVLGSTTVLAGTGALRDENDAREASAPSGGIPLLGSARVLHAAAISSIDGWDAQDSVASEASLADLGLSVGGNAISAAFVMARSLAPVGGAAAGRSDIEGLVINGAAVTATGAANQVVPILGGRIILNEQRTTAGGLVVNALRIVVDGLADIAIASAAAGLQPPDSGGTTVLPSLPPLL